MKEEEIKKFTVVFFAFVAIWITSIVITAISDFSILVKIRDIVILTSALWAYLSAYAVVSKHGFGDKFLLSITVGMVISIAMLKWDTDISAALNIAAYFYLDVGAGVAVFLLRELLEAATSQE